MRQNIRVLMEAIKSEILPGQFNAAEFCALSQDEQNEIVNIAGKHSVEMLLGDALGKNPETKALPAAKKLVQRTLAILQYITKMERETEKICSCLDESRIPYIRLKGARIRHCYPELWMRFSCDIDILVPDREADKAADILSEQLGFQKQKRGFHDIALYSPEGMHLELHFSIKEEDPVMDPVLERVWQYSRPAGIQGKSEYLMDNDFFVFHLIAHMAHHFIMGGCGIRPFMDLLIVREKIPYHETEVAEFCRQAGILQFCKNAGMLMNVWFGTQEHNEITQRMENFVLSGGIFGTLRNRTAMAETKQGGKVKYICSQLFMPAESLCRKYPSLRRHLWLMPLYQVRRWCSLTDRKTAQRAKTRLKAVQKLDREFSSEAEKILLENGLL